MGFDVGGVVLSASGGGLSVDAGATNWMKVNPNGILTRPRTPYFRGQTVARGGVYQGPTLILQADENVGNCWNVATGKWTCPVLGYYMMTGGFIGGQQAGYFYFMKNNVSVHYTHWNHTASYMYVSLSDILFCAAGDTLHYQIGGFTPAGAGIYGEGGHGMYSIALMA